MIRLLLFLLLVTGQTTQPLIVTNDPGGPLASRAAHIAQLGNRQVRIEGFCASACTMYLHAPRVCVTSSARLLFHGPNLWGFPLPPKEFETWSRFMAAHYPPTLRGWFMTTGRFGEFTISGAGAIQNGWALECP